MTNNKTVYGINYRSMHTAIHGILLFEERKFAEESLNTLKEIDNANIDEECVQSIYDNTYSLIDEIHCQKIKPQMNNINVLINEQGRVHPVSVDIVVINDTAIDLYNL